MPKMVISGNHAQSYGVKLARAEVIAAYPITPQTQIVEKIADFIANAEMKAQYIQVESEHSAMAACIAASATGARTYTATSSHGLALMHELLTWASGSRLPIVMGNVNRAMAPPWSVWCDHMDSMAERDTGWIQFYCESNQEVLDTVIQAYKICEDGNVMLPAMIMEDAFYLSHTIEAVDMPEQAKVDEFLPPYNPPLKLDVEDPKGFCSLVTPDLYMEFRYNLARAMEEARKKIIEVDEDFERKFGRSHGGLLEKYGCDGADVVLIAMGTIASTAKEVVDAMRDKGRKVGLAKLRVFRPFPTKDIRELAKEVNAIGVLDRSYTSGYGGAAFCEVGGSLYNSSSRPILKNYIAGLGGRDVTPKILEEIYEDLLHLREGAVEIDWIGLKRPHVKKVV